MRIGFIFVALLSVFFSLYGQVVETPYFHNILEHVDHDTLVVLDIDDTLLITDQMLGCDEWFRHRVKVHREEGADEHEALESALDEWEAIRYLTKMHVVEPGTDTIVQELQEKGYTVMGLTTQGLSLARRTVAQLKENGIDLSISSPSQRDLFLLIRDHGVLYRKGILFTSGTHKGEALFALCNATDYTPKKIVFINDKAENILEIGVEAEKRGLEFLGLRYSFSDAYKGAFDPELADFQFAHSTLNHLLSDDEAKIKAKAKGQKDAGRS
jgi:hypothetical protein